MNWKMTGKKKRPVAFNIEKEQPDSWLSAYPLNYRDKSGRGFWRKTFYRLMVALAILALLMTIRDFSHPAGFTLREGLRYTLTTEWNFQPVIQKAVQLGLQMVNVDHQFPGYVPSDAQEVLGRNDLSKGLMTPVSGKVVRKFGWSVDPIDGLERFHPGIDISAALGTPVRAVRAGKIARVGNDPVLGYYILLAHGEGSYTFYACLRIPDSITEGENIDRGQIVGEIGSVGDVPGGGLHFEMRKKGKLVDPLPELKIP